MSNTEVVYSASLSGDESSDHGTPVRDFPARAHCRRGRRQISLVLCACGAFPALVMAAISPVRSTCFLWAFGTLPWVFGAMAATGWPTDSSGRAWNLVLGGVLLLDGWFGLGTLLSRDVYYTMMVHATPFLNIAVLVSGYGLLMVSPAISRRLLRRRSLSVSASQQLGPTKATNLAAR